MIKKRIDPDSIALDVCIGEDVSDNKVDSTTFVPAVPEQIRSTFYMHQSQQQNVAVDNTTVNNIFRSEMGGWKEAVQKILTEFLLSFLEPDRFLKNAKAIFILSCAWLLKDFTPEEIKTFLAVIFK